MKRLFYPALFILILAITTISCDNHVHDDSEHEEATGLRLSVNETLIVEYLAPADPVGEFVLLSNSDSEVITVTFLNSENVEFTPTDAAYSLELEIEGTVFSYTPVQSNKWQFQLNTLQVGTGTFVVKLLHNDHADFRSKPITVRSVQTAKN